MNDPLEHTTSSNQRPIQAFAPIISRSKSAVMIFLASIAFAGLPVVAHAGSQTSKVDSSNYDVPLKEQIRNHIKAKVAAKLGDGKSPRDRYFIVPFAYENRGNDPAFSHSFMSVIRVFADDKHAAVTQGLKLRKYKNREFEAFTISWLPHDFLENPQLCVFEGVGSRIFATRNTCPLSVGKSFQLDDTIKLAVSDKNALAMWGPYEITKPAFDLGVRRMRLLNAGTIKYRADDRLYRKNRVAINCFHAMAGLEELFPNGGLFGTGFKMWGLNGTARVLIEYKARATKQGLLLDPVDVKNDRYGFVYASSLTAQDIYNPFKRASAYWK